MQDLAAIHIKGARLHNLKGIDVDIPRNRFVVITGLSGSGKSSLAFDTLYAEGQRRYVQSLSSYARQFLGRMQKPEVDSISGIPPAIAIQQKTSTRNPRSTVGTSTEIYDYMKLLFARVGVTVSPVSGQIVKQHTAQDIVNCAMDQPLGTKILLLVKVQLPPDRTMGAQLFIWQSQGFIRLISNGTTLLISDLIDGKELPDIHDLWLVVDRIVSDGNKSTANRFTDSVETALYEGKGNCTLRIIGETDDKNINFSTRFEADGIIFQQPTAHLFDFNNPLGACPTCSGFGNIIGIDPDLVVPDKSLSLSQQAIACWRGEKMGLWLEELLTHAHKFDFPVHTPFYQLTPEQKQLIWTGNQYFHGLNDFFRMLESQQYAKIQYRVMLSRYRGRTTCPDCLGSKLRKEAQYVKVGGKSISELVTMPVSQLAAWFGQLNLDENQQITAKRLLREINSRLQFLLDVGLGYLTLNRQSNTLSGGESQRISLATALGSSLVGSLYVLDEPSIGLHQSDTQRLIKVFRQLRDIGNTVVVVEHDPEIIAAADYIIDIGPDAGRAGGKLVLAEDMAKLKKFNHEQIKQQYPQSYTLAYMCGSMTVDKPAFRRQWKDAITIKGACENNLKNITVKIPLGVITVVSGPSGSGKSSLIKQILYPALKKYYGYGADKTGAVSAVEGQLNRIRNVELVDQSMLSRSTRSNPVTYIKAYDHIRTLFAQQQLAKQMGFTPMMFSFNTPGGRCEECEGEGTITIPMQFMADLTMTCEHCHGKRFKQDILDVTYNGMSIYDVLEMTINQAVEFFSASSGTTEKRIVQRLKPLQDVGIGYIKLGQSSSTLSGGEAQRLKLAAFLANENEQPTMFIFDEPTTGLHTHDINTLMKAINALIAKGHTAVIVEHNLEVIKNADYVIDLGPGGGDNGGALVFAGTPEQLIQNTESLTAKALRNPATWN